MWHGFYVAFLGLFYVYLLFCKNTCKKTRNVFLPTFCFQNFPPHFILSEKTLQYCEYHSKLSFENAKH